MNNHTEVLMAVAAMYGGPRYLEIGIGDGGNFERVAQYCLSAIAVDVADNPYGPEIGPRVSQLLRCSYYGEGSDAFFTSEDRQFDLIFIDGSHWAEQVRKDWLNSLRVLAPCGTIALHDTWAATEQEIREGSGTAYQVAEAIEVDPAFDCFTVPIRPGLTLARPRMKRFS
jgi:hypothetical protein